jgi:hypothetical protein
MTISTVAARPDIGLPSTRLFIGGEWRDAAAGGTFDVLSR